MSIPSSLTVSQFWEKLKFAGRPEFELVNYRQQSQDGAGNILSAKFGQPKWRADVATASGRRHDDDMEMQALIKAVVGRNLSFLAYDIRRPFPLLDPGGVSLSGFSPTIKSVGANNRSLSLEGLPAHFNLSVADKISVTDGNNHNCLLELMEAVGTGTDNDTAEFEVQPFLPTWLAVGNAVDLTKPPGRFRIVAGSYKPQSGGGNLTDGFSFSMISVPSA